METVSAFDLPDPTLFAIPVFIISIIIETIVLIKYFNEKYDYSEALASIGMGVGVVFVNLASKAFYLWLFLIIYQFRLIDTLGVDTFADFFNYNWHKQHWWVWVIILFLDDFTFYWCHRLSHEVRVLWAGHVNHHSSQEYNLAIALRQGWWEDIYKYLFWCWLPFIGFHPAMIFFMIQFNLIYQFFVHTKLVKKLGFLEYFMNTPSHHRVHHGSDIAYLDKNYGGIFIIWDKIFNTFIEETITPTYGLTNNINTKNPLKIATHEIISLGKDVIKAPTLNNKLKYLLLGPGWSHDGEDKRAKIIQNKQQT